MSTWLPIWPIKRTEMNEIALANRAADWRRLKTLVLDSVSSPITKRVYNLGLDEVFACDGQEPRPRFTKAAVSAWPVAQEELGGCVLGGLSAPITKRVYNLGLDEFFAWYGQEPRPGFTKATVSAWRVALEGRGLGSVSINVRITAVRKLAVEAADNGLLAPELAAGITRVKGAKSVGVRVGNWLSVQQAQRLLNTPDVTTKKGLRDRAMLAILLGCGLRRSEVAALTLKHIQQRDNRWCIVDLVGKHGRVRTIPMPTWVKVAIDTWTGPTGITDGHVLRRVSRGDVAHEEGMSEKVVWQLLQGYAATAGVPGIAPHDLDRKSTRLNSSHLGISYAVFCLKKI